MRVELMNRGGLGASVSLPKTLKSVNEPLLLSLHSTLGKPLRVLLQAIRFQKISKLLVAFTRLKAQAPVNLTQASRAKVKGRAVRLSQAVRPIHETVKVDAMFDSKGVTSLL